MISKKRVTVVFSDGVGLVSRFGRKSRRFVRVKDGSLHDGEILLQLTLKELGIIRRLSKEMGGFTSEFTRDARTRYDDLYQDLQRLAEGLESTNILQFFKYMEIRRETHDLVDTAYRLYVTVKSTSNTLQRNQLSRTSTVEEIEEGEISTVEESRIRGIAFDMDGAIDNETESVLTNPFEDPAVPHHNVPSQNTYNVFIGCVNADKSNARQITMNNA